MKKYIAIFLASFLIFFSIIGGIYYYLDKTHNNMIDEDFNQTIIDNPEYRPPDAATETVVNTLVLGVNEGLSDIMTVVRYNKENHKIAVISVPRDTRVTLPGQAPCKINSLLSKKEGVALVMKTVGDILDIPIHHYVTIGLSGAAKVVDAIGGVEINVPQDMYYSDPTQNLLIDIKAGKQVLNGKKSVEFIRYRKGYIDQDLGRIRAQHEFIKAFVKKLTSPSILPKAFNIVNTMSKYVKTNLTEKEITQYALGVKNIQLDNIQQYTIPGDAPYIDNVSYFVYDAAKLSVMMDEINAYMGADPDIANTAQDDTVKNDANNNAENSEASIRKNIKIEVLNSTKTSGLATDTKKELEALGYTVVRIGDVNDIAFSQSRIVNKSGDMDKVAQVKKDMDISIVDNDIDNSYDCDITIILGKDREK